MVSSTVLTPEHNDCSVSISNIALWVSILKNGEEDQEGRNKVTHNTPHDFFFYTFNFL